jgi:hypothetical protein
VKVLQLVRGWKNILQDLAPFRRDNSTRYFGTQNTYERQRRRSHSQTAFLSVREIGLAKNIAKEVLRIAGDPAVAVGNRGFRVNRNELNRAVLFPDARCRADA